MLLYKNILNKILTCGMRQKTEKNHKIILKIILKSFSKYAWNYLARGDVSTK